MDWKQRLLNKLFEGMRFIRFVVFHFINDGCTYRASALAFTSLLAIIPLMTVSLAILSSFPVFQGLAGPVQDFIFDNFVPATGKAVQNYLQQFAAQVSNLSIWGVAILFITALLVMVTIERSLNRIWRASSSRHGVTAFLLYWAILSLGPVLLGLSLAASSYLFSIPFIKNHPPPSILMSCTPFLLSLIGFTFLYVVVPNCPVKLSHGLWGGIVAALLFESAKLAFAYYLARYNSYQLLYGAFATIPIFFVWVYWVWIITLLGAEISYAFSVHHQRRTGKPLDGFSHALLWLYQLWQAQKKGKSLSFDSLVNADPQPFSIDPNQMLNELERLELIHATENGQFMLSRDLNQLTLYSLSQQLPYRLPTHADLEGRQPPEIEHLKPFFKRNDLELQKNLATDLNQLFTNLNQHDDSH
ncbi:YihY family inner membrane protein [Legionella fairfieldensis]|uniref:YihY family inner membrane protein n=1 Tax=Legionella fairfieldensis TaxID=45064 RepID=UPI0004910579|nr:YihY family inner membrane protein [Legionella fairfieldensis]